MKIKFRRNSNISFLNKFLNVNFFFKFYFFFTIIFLIFLSLVFFQSGTWERNKKTFFERIHLNGIYNYKFLPEILYYKINSLFEDQKKIYISIDQKNILKIESNRKDILDFLDGDQKTFQHVVPFKKASAFILDKNKKLKIGIRLKGDRNIHFEDRKNSSYRIDVKRGEVFSGMKKFSIQKPRIRNYLTEWIFHELLGEENLVKPKYDFYDFYLNGKYAGYYSLEESFGKVLLERNKRRNGPIFSTFEDVNTFLDENKYEVYNKKFWEKDENIIIVKSAIQKMNSYLEGHEKFENVFDIEKWAWFFAVTDLTYTYHGVGVKSVKFYYNPINGKFEPIGFDGHRFLPNYSKYILKKLPELNSTNFSKAKKKNTSKDEYTRSFWPTIEKDFFYQNGKLNENFYQAYLKAIKKITSKDFLDNFFKVRKHQIKKINSGIYTDSYKYDVNTRRKSGLGIYFFDKKEIYRRAEFLSKNFSVNKAALFIEENTNKLTFINYDTNNYFLKNGKIICENYKIDLINLRINKKKSDIKTSNKYNPSCKKISFQDSISGNYFVFDINKYNSFNKDAKTTKLNFLDIFKARGNQLFLKEKSTKINKNIFIPKGYKVIIKGGQEIILENNSFIFSNSSWQIGDYNKKTTIKGSKENFGGGIIIYDNKKKNLIVNSEFKYLSGLKKNKFDENNFFNERLIMGSVNFFQSDVIIKDTIFDNILSEDALNIVSSNYKISKTNFQNIRSDAIDIDFGNGKIEESVFFNIGNDAIDFSGSKSELFSIDFKKVGDKGISVGENSNIKISDVIGKNALVGIATKDGSETFAKNISFSNIDYPFAAYQKKKAYNYGKLYLDNFSLDNFKQKFIRDNNSIIYNNRTNDVLGNNNKKVDKIIEEII